MEEESLLDRSFRMTKADSSAHFQNNRPHIAVPITKEAKARLFGDPSVSDVYPWLTLIAAHGRQKVPYSTSVLGRR